MASKYTQAYAAQTKTHTSQLHKTVWKNFQKQFKIQIVIADFISITRSGGILRLLAAEGNCIHGWKALFWKHFIHLLIVRHALNHFLRLWRFCDFGFICMHVSRAYFLLRYNLLKLVKAWQSTHNPYTCNYQFK